MRLTPRERFETKYTRADTCFLWTAGKFRFGYGCFRINGKSKPAHRMAWELYRGPLPDGSTVLHTCNVPACVNPDHLYLGPNAGEHHGRSKLTATQVRAIRADPRRKVRIADDYGVTATQVANIKTHKSWRHI